MELFRNANYNFLKWKWVFIALSLVLSVSGCLSLLAKGGPVYGIDFRGGTLVYAKFQQAPPLDRLHNMLRSLGMGESAIQAVRRRLRARGDHRPGPEDPAGAGAGYG